jgi:hypothetical protein
LALMLTRIFKKNGCEDLWGHQFRMLKDVKRC